MPHTPDRLNVLLIMTDQHRADLMTCAGRDLVPTPNLDRLAGRGVRFENAYCAYPVCVASRMAMLTGLYAHTTGAINNTDRLDWRYRTMAHHFAGHGYLTGLVGKMHFNDAMNHGFEYYLSINDWLMCLGPKVQDYANEIANHQIGPRFFETVDDDGSGFPDLKGMWDGPSPWVGHVERWGFDDVASPLEPEDHLDAFISRETVKFLRQHQDSRFFLVASFMKPHPPLHPPREWAEMYPVDEMEWPGPGDVSQYPPHTRNRINGLAKLGEKRLKAHRAGYLGNLAFVDTCIGPVTDALDELGLWDNTIVVYTSDHGDMDGDHGLLQKFCSFEPSIKVPLIVCYPPQIPRGQVTQALTEQFGLFPTLVELAGVDPPEATKLTPRGSAAPAMDAKSFADVARDPGLPGPPAAFCEYNLRAPVCQYTIRGRRHKLVYNHGSTPELYDLEADPGECVNRAADPGLAAVQADLVEKLLAWYDPESNPYRPSPCPKT